MFVSNERMDVIISKNKLEFRKCGKEYGRVFVEGIFLEPHLPQKPYYTLFSINEHDVGEITAVEGGFASVFRIKNRHHSSLNISFTLSFESITYDELRDAYLINKKYYFYFSDGKLEGNKIVINVSPIEEKKFFFLFAEKDKFDKYLLTLSQNTSFLHMQYFDKTFFTTIEHALESMNVTTKDERYNEYFQYLKSFLIRMIKLKDDAFVLCKLKGELKREEMFLFLPYFIKSGGERVARYVFIKHKDLITNYLYLYALKHYVEHTTDFKFYETLMKEKHKLKTSRPRNIYEKLARIAYLNKYDDSKEVDAFMHELVLEEEKINRSMLLLFLPFLKGHIYNIVKAFIIKDEFFRGLLYALKIKNLEILREIKDEESAAFSLLFLLESVVDFKVDGLHQELTISVPKHHAYDRAKMVYNDVVNLQISYDLAKNKLFIDYDVLDKLYTLKVSLPKELEVLLNGKSLGKVKSLIYEVM